ncbi:MAG: nucleotidyltransferase substrate binding protein [Clostridiales bacterium]|nr:nucleotidyltransferase substrate binding protein [Clostridiales bacterium]
MDNDLNQIYRQGAAIGRARFQERYTNFVRAIQRLEESIADYERFGLDSIRDGVIQRFEFCAELAWKTVREYLLDQGYSGVNSPKSVMKLAYADGLLQEEQGWLALLNARNLTSHLYDEAAAQTVFEEVRAVYLPLLKDLAQRLS